MAIKPLETVQNCCEVVIAILDGKYGWMSEAISILVVVIVFNFLINAILKKLHDKFEKERKYWKNSFVSAIYKPLSYFFSLLALIYSIEFIYHRVFQENFFNKPFKHLLFSLGGIAALTWFLFRWKNNVIKVMLVKARENEKGFDLSKVDMISKLGSIGIVLVNIILLMQVTGYQMTTLIAFGGVGGLAIAFASQKIVANLFSGVMIYMSGPFAVGDWINLPERNLEGHVEEIGWYMTLIRNFEKRPIYVPNFIFSEQVIVTPSRMSHRHFDQHFGIRYEDISIIKEMMNTIKDMLAQHYALDHRQAKAVNLDALGKSSLELRVEAYTQKIGVEEYYDVRQDLLFKISEIVSSHQAEFAYPTTIIEMKEKAMPQSVAQNEVKA